MHVWQKPKTFLSKIWSRKINFVTVFCTWQLNSLLNSNCDFLLYILFSVEEIESAAVPPKFIKKITPIEVLEGNPARFDCKVTGSPRPEIKWYREEEEIVSSPYMRIQSSPDGSSSMIIQEVFADDSGRFTVKASNPAGEVQSSAHLVVQGMGVCMVWLKHWLFCLWLLSVSVFVCLHVWLSLSCAVCVICLIVLNHESEKCSGHGSVQCSSGCTRYGCVHGVIETLAICLWL